MSEREPEPLTEGDPITIVRPRWESTDSRAGHDAVRARARFDGVGWSAFDTQNKFVAIVPTKSEGILWERGWTDGASLLAAFKLVRSSF